MVDFATIVTLMTAKDEVERHLVGTTMIGEVDEFKMIVNIAHLLVTGALAAMLSVSVIRRLKLTAILFVRWSVHFGR